MIQNTILPDDPRLTAYALGEMEPAERAEFEKQLQQDAAARRTVAEIRVAIASLSDALAEEPLPMAGEHSPAHAANIPGKDVRRLDGGPMLPEGWLGKKIRFPQFYYVVSGLAAACFAVFFVYWQRHQPEHENKKYVEVALSAGSGADPAKSVTVGLPAVEPAIADHAADAEDDAFPRDSGFPRVVDNPLSTFSADVDTASYAKVRRLLQNGQRPPADAVRIEELVNYFPYDYSGPDRNGPKGEISAPPFAANLEVASAPWAPEHRLVRIGLKGREVPDAARPRANLVFLLDVSGSMNEPNRLSLMKKSLRLLVDKLRPDDRVAMTVWAGSSGLALPSTPVSHRAEIMDAIDRLDAKESTSGAMGLEFAYQIAKANFVAGGVNRVILATDGDFNVGVAGQGELVRLIQEKARSGVSLSVLGFGLGHLKDRTLEQFADKGNGNYASIDSLAEAKKTLVEQAGGTLVTIAKDVKLQVEFNPAVVQAYRLIGYDHRILAKEDFNADKIDAGEIGAGHIVTALYEVVPVGIALNPAPGVDPLNYRKTENHRLETAGVASTEMLTVKIRYKEPAGDVSNKLEFPLYDKGARFADATDDFKFAASVAAFGMVLRDSPYKGSATLAEVAAWGRAGIGRDTGGYRHEFLGLVARSEAILR